MNNDYWIKRRARQLHAQLEVIEDKNEQLARVYSLASMQIEEQARKIINRFEIEHPMTRKRALELLNKSRNKIELSVLRAMLKRDPRDADLLAELNAPAYGARLKRLREVQDEVDAVCENLRDVTEQTTTQALTQMATDTYNHTVYDMQQRVGAAFPFSALDQQTVDKLLSSRWSGENYSTRIWRNTDELAKRVKDEILTSVLTGTSATSATQKIADEFNVTASQARRLLRTEACYVDGQIRLKQFKDIGVTKYIFVAILDMRTSLICRAHDKKRYLVKNAEVGKNYPPLHPWCRSSAIADIPDELLARLKQSAVDPISGERMEVPLSMTYDEWFDKYGPKPVDIVPLTHEGMRELIPIKYDYYGAVKPVYVEVEVEDLKAETIANTPRVHVSIKDDIVIPWDRLSAIDQHDISVADPDQLGKPLVITREEVAALTFSGSARDLYDETTDDAVRNYNLTPIARRSMTVTHTGFLDAHLDVVFYYDENGNAFAQVGTVEPPQKRISDETMNAIYAREEEVSRRLRKMGVRWKDLTGRRGPDFNKAMEAFHTAVEADNPVTLTTREQYDALKSEEIYRGIASESLLRTDIGGKIDTMKAAKQYMEGGVGDCYPSRGVYGDGVSYNSSRTSTGYSYATNSGYTPHGGTCIRSKVKDDAVWISYEDARDIFNMIAAQHRDDGSPYFSKNQRAMKNGVEVGKAMQILGYDYIFEENGDGAPHDHFYIILRRDAVAGLYGDYVEFTT